MFAVLRVPFQLSLRVIEMDNRSHVLLECLQILIQKSQTLPEAFALFVPGGPVVTWGDKAAKTNNCWAPVTKAAQIAASARAFSAIREDPRDVGVHRFWPYFSIIVFWTQSPKGLLFWLLVSALRSNVFLVNRFTWIASCCFLPCTFPKNQQQRPNKAATWLSRYTCPGLRLQDGAVVKWGDVLYGGDLDVIGHVPGAQLRQLALAEGSRAVRIQASGRALLSQEKGGGWGLGRGGGGGGMRVVLPYVASTFVRTIR